MIRSYDTIAAQISQTGDDVVARMQAVVDLLWEHLFPTGLSWVGFYLPDETESNLLLGPRRDKPACSPIGLHGACGQAFLQKNTVIVHDVAELGEKYIACDPRDKSEIVLPLLNQDGRCWAVLDLDSHNVGSFDKSDEQGLTKVLKAANLIP